VTELEQALTKGLSFNRSSLCNYSSFSVDVVKNFISETFSRMVVTNVVSFLGIKVDTREHLISLSINGECLIVLEGLV